MTILCVGYTDKFSRFFLKIKRELSISNRVLNFKIHSISLGGFLYSFLRFSQSNWISVYAWILANVRSKKYHKIIHSNTNYKGIDYKDLINYHQKLNPKKTDSYLKQALSYIDIYDLEFRNNKPDFVLMIGDSRLAFEACIAVCKLYNIKIYFIEIGPFETTIFDEKGVNANASFLEEYLAHKKTNVSKLNPQKEFISEKKYLRNPIYRSLDYLFDLVFSNTRITPPDLKETMSVLRYKNSVLKNKKTSVVKYGHTFLLILQVPEDVNMVYHSPHFKSQFEILKEVFRNLPKNSRLIVKEHPVFTNCYGASFYDFIATHLIELDNKTALNTQLNNADVVIVNNSTVGIETMALYKTIVVLGNAYYNYNEVCLSLQKEDELSSILEDSLKFKISAIEVDNFINYYKNNYAIKGGIEAKNCRAAISIAEILNSKFNRLTK